MGGRPPPGQCVEGMTTRKSQGVGGAHAPAQVVLCGAWWEGTARRSGDWDGGGYRLQILRKGGRGAGARLLLLFAHSFAEGEAGVGLDWTPLAPLSTPWAMGAGEKNGTRTGEGGEGRAYRGIYLVPPKCQRCLPGLHLRGARPGLGQERGAGGHSEVAGGKTKVLMRDPASSPPPAEDEGVHGSASMLGYGGRSPGVRLLPRKIHFCPPPGPRPWLVNPVLC